MANYDSFILGFFHAKFDQNKEILKDIILEFP